MIYSLTISLAIVLSIIDISVANCPPTNQFWPKIGKFSDFSQKYQPLSDDEIHKLINQTVSQQCHEYTKLSKWLKLNNINWLADESEKNCQYDLDDNAMIIGSISKLTDPGDRHRHLVKQAQWLDYMLKYLQDTSVYRKQCTLEDRLKYVKTTDVKELAKLVADKHRQVLAEMQKEVDLSRSVKEENFWIPLDTKALEDSKRQFANDEKDLAKISPESIKIKSMKLLILKLDYLIRVYQAIHA
ncbi:uncharacterized protein LOC128953400 [Oppia nitens]|uniref:uncharacterized protein LOC128953400 n=1 Tax=Oppia nitens TaxID=1686743 RepID=UPI0023DA152F|nr:uncharacterized protein LOC128953400 [Oppia nitens]